MVLCRVFELSLVRHASQDGVGIPHPYTGQEGVGAGVCCALEPEDRVVSPHRMLGHAIAKGCELAPLALELYGRSSGLCRGRSGEMYLSDYEHGFMGATQIVGGNMPMGVGLALAASLDGSRRVVIAFVGDGAVNQGAFHEALNLAAIWRLPFVVVVENNGYAESTPTEYATAGTIVGRATGYDIPGAAVDGQDAIAVHRCASEAIARARRGEGPSLIEARTYRYGGHYYGEQHRRYRSGDEVKAWRARDPIAIHRREMIASGIDERELDEIDRSAKETVDQALAVARSGPEPTWDDLVDDVLAPTEVGTLYVERYLTEEGFRA